MRGVKSQPARCAPEHGVLGVAEGAFLVRQKSKAFVVERDARPAGERRHHDASYLRSGVLSRVAGRADMETCLRKKAILYLGEAIMTDWRRFVTLRTVALASVLFAASASAASAAAP